MATVTQTFTDTLTIGAVPPIVQTISTTLTITSEMVATPGQTVTVFLPFSASAVVPTSEYTPNVPASATTTATVTELDVLFASSEATYWTTLTFDSNGEIESNGPGVTNLNWQVVVIGSPARGWDAWDPAQKAGLIAGMACLGLILLISFVCTYRRREWVTHDVVAPRDIMRTGWHY